MLINLARSQDHRSKVLFEIQWELPSELWLIQLLAADNAFPSNLKSAQVLLSAQLFNGDFQGI